MLLHNSRSFVEDGWHLTLQKESTRWYTLHADMVFMTEQFREFQLTVIEEAIAQIQELLENDDVLFDDLVRWFENILQDTNEKLVLFADKMTSVQQFDIRGMITISQHLNFVSAVIGNTSIVLIRRGHIGYTMQNDSDTRQKVSLFSDIIEWDMLRDDVLMFFGAHIESLMDRDDMEHVLQKVVTNNNEELLQAWVDDLWSRAPLSDIWVVVQYAVNAKESRVSWSKFSVPMPQSMRWVSSRASQIFSTTRLHLQNKLKQRQFIVMLAWIGVFLLFVVWSLVHGWIKNYSTATINPDWSVTSALSIEDIKKEIFAFQKLDPTSDEKANKYNALLKELNRIQLEWKWANDVQQLKKILNTEYLQWFNIITLDSLAEQMIYEFSSLETSTLQKPIWLFFSKWLYVAGSQGAILWGISSDIKWTSVRNSASDAFTTCAMNLLRNWLYCATEKNALYHVAKAWAETIWWENISFPWSIVGLWTFGSSNFYVLTNDANYTKDNTFITRYTNTLGSQNIFGGAMSLPLLQADAATEYPNWFSSIAIDWSFLVWSKDKKSLLQFYRNPQDKALTSRVVPLKWGTNLDEWLSDDIKVMTSVWSKYVYLYDRTHKNLSVYLSSPLKTSESYATSYDLTYVMRLDFDSLQNSVIDVAVDESDGKQIAYVLTDIWVAKVPMSDLLDTLKKTRETTQ